MTEVEEIQYSEKYADEQYEYRHVIVPNNLIKLIPKNTPGKRKSFCIFDKYRTKIQQ